jgi:hypothetical protein
MSCPRVSELYAKVRLSIRGLAPKMVPTQSYRDDEGTATTANCELSIVKWPEATFNSAVIYKQPSIAPTATYDHSTGTCAGAHLELLS